MKNSKKKILITDDSEINRSILSDMLEDEFEIIEAENGLQAVSSLQKYGEEISLVLLDIVMPEMDGFEVLAISYLCRFAVRAPQKYTQLFSPSSIPDFGSNFPRSLPEPTPGSETSNVSLCLTLLVVTESLPSVHRLRLSASP